MGTGARGGRADGQEGHGRESGRLSARRLGPVAPRPERRFLRGRVAACVRRAWREPGVRQAQDQRWLPSRPPVTTTQGEGTPVRSPCTAVGVSARASRVWGSPSPPPGEPAQEEGADQQEGTAGHCGHRSRSAGVSQRRLRKCPQGPGLPPALGSAFPSPRAVPSPTGLRFYETFLFLFFLVAKSMFPSHWETTVVFLERLSSRPGSAASDLRLAPHTRAWGPVPRLLGAGARLHSQLPVPDRCDSKSR